MAGDGVSNPGWALSTDDESVRALRSDTYRAAKLAEQFFEGVANPKIAQFPVERIVGFYEPRSAAAFYAFISRLRNLLFNQPKQMLGSHNEPVVRWLIELLAKREMLDFIQFVERIERINTKEDLPPESELLSFFRQWISDLQARLANPSLYDLPDFGSTSGKVALNRWESEISDMRKELEVSFAVAKAATESDSLLEDIEHARDAAQRAAGQTGNLKLGEHFRLIAAREEKAEQNYTVGVFVALLLTLLIGSSAVMQYSAESDEWSDALFHLALVLPVVGAASYASRIAGHHRMLARWAKTASVQVDSIDAFAQQLSEVENRDSLILQLGHNVFGSPTFGDGSKGEHYSTVPPEVADILKEIASKVTPGQGRGG